MAASEIHTDPERIKEVISCLPVFVAELMTGFDDIMDAFKHLGDTWRDEEYDHFKKCLEPLHRTIDEMTQELVRQHAHLQSDMENLLSLRQITQGEAGLSSPAAGVDNQPGMGATMMEPQSRETDKSSKDTALRVTQQGENAQLSTADVAAVRQAPAKKSGQAQSGNNKPSRATLNPEESDAAKMPVRVPVPTDKVAAAPIAAPADDFEFRQLTGKHLLILAMSEQLTASIALAALRGALAQCVPNATRIVIANFLLPELTVAEFASMLPKTFSDRVTVLNNWHDLANLMQKLEDKAEPIWPSSNRLPDFWATASWHKQAGSTLHVELLSPSVGEIIPFGPCDSELIQKVMEFLCEHSGIPLPITSHATV